MKNMRKEIMIWLGWIMWVTVVVLPLLGAKLEGDMLSFGISFAGLTIGLAILLQG